MNKRKIIGFILGLILFSITITSLTYAFYSWQSGETNVTFNINDQYFYCETDIPTNVSNLTSVVDYKSGVLHKFKVNNVANKDTTFSVSMNIVSIDEVLKSESFKYKLVVDKSNGGHNCQTENASTDENTSGCYEVATGNFKNVHVGNNNLVPSINLPNNSRYEYYFFMYIDGNISNPTEMQNATMTSTLGVCDIYVTFDVSEGETTVDPVYKKVIEGDKYGTLPTPVRSNAVITFNSNGGSSVASQTVSFTFNGWKSSIDNLIKTANSDVNTSLNHTFTAQWTRSNSVVQPTNPTKEGYTFKGWYTTSDFQSGTEVTFPYNPEKSGTLYAKWADDTAPVATIESTTSTINATSQTVSLKCTDGVGVTKYYWGTSSSPADSAYTTVTTATTWTKTDATANSQGTYRLICKDTAGNTSTAATQIYRKYTVNRMLLNLNGTKGTYNTTNYTKVNNNDYVIPNGTTMTMSDVYKPIPTGTNVSRYKGYNTAAPSETAATLLTNNPTISANNTVYTVWFDRAEYSVKANSGIGGTVKIETVIETGNSVTAAAGGNATLTVRYGDTVKATATPATGYSFNQWTGYITGNTNPKTGTAVTENKTTDAKAVNGSFTDDAPTCSIAGGTTAKKTIQPFTLNGADARGVTAYYWGTSNSPADSAYTEITSNTSWTLTGDGTTSGGAGNANSATTYYLKVKDASGNVCSANVVVRSYAVHNMLLNLNGTKGTYNTTNYTRSGSATTYYIKTGENLAPSNVCTAPTGGDALLGYNLAAPSTTAATLTATSTNITMSTNRTVSCWYNRKEYSVKANSGTGGTVKIETVTQTGNSVTAVAGGDATLIVRHGDKVKATATPATGYSFASWSGYVTGSTNPVTGANVTEDKTIDAKAVNGSFTNDAPTATIANGTTAKKTVQPFKLTCSDAIGVTEYYWGTTEPTASSTFTSITSNTSWTVTGDGTTVGGVGNANSATTYWLGCKDASGGIGKASVVVRSLNVYNMLLNINGTETSYNTSNYTQSSNPTYYIKTGTSLTAANMCTKRTGGNTLKGYNEAAPSETTATLKSSSLSISANKTISCWYNRLTYYVDVTSGANGSVTATTLTQTENSITAAAGETKTLTVRYGDNVIGTATPNTGYSFTSWSGYLFGSVSPAAGSQVKANKRGADGINATFSVNSYTISCTLNGGSGGCSSVTSASVDDIVTIPKPTKSFVVTLDSNSTGATLSSNTVSKAQTFAGWTSESGLNTSTAKYGSSASDVTTSWSNTSTAVGADYATTYFKNLRIDSGTVNLTANWTIVDITLPTITKTGYTCGFSNDQNSTTIDFTSGGIYRPSSVTNSVTLYAVCIAKEFKVTYRSNGGYMRDSEDSGNVLFSFSGYLNKGTGHSSNTSLSTWTNLDATHLHFDGTVIDGTWGADYLSFNGTSTAVDTGSNIAPYYDDLVTYMITFSVPEVTSTTTRYLVNDINSGGGGLYVTSDGYIGGMICIRSDDIPGSCSSDDYSRVTFNTQISANTVYTVALVYDSSSVLLYVNGSLVDDVTVYGTIIVPSNATHAFIGCNPTGDQCQGNYFKGNVYEAVILNKRLDGTKIFESSYKTVTYDSAYGSMPSPTRAGYIFDGWYTAGSGGTRIESTSIYEVDGDQVLYAHWSPLIPDGHYKVVVSSQPEFALHVDGAKVSNGSNVELYTADNSDGRTKAEVIDVGNYGDGYIRLLNHHSQKALEGIMNLDISTVHYNLQLGSNNHDYSKRWQLVPIASGGDSSYILESAYQYRGAIHVAYDNFANDQNVELLETNYSSGMRWSFIPITTYDSYTYTIAYNKNGGTGTNFSTSNINWKDAHTLATNTFTKTNYTFNGWNSKADGTGIAYANGGKYAGLTNVNGGTVTLYAQWKPTTWTMYPKTALACRSGPGTSYSVTKTYTCGTAITVTDKSNSSWYKTSDNCYSSSTYLQTSSTPCN